MPRVDGALEVLRQVKSDPHLKSIPVVMLTSSREANDSDPAYDLGVTPMWSNPWCSPSSWSAVKVLGQFWAVINEPPPA